MFEAFQVVVHCIGRDYVFRQTKALNGVMPCSNDRECRRRAEKPDLQEGLSKSHLRIIQQTWKPIFSARVQKTESQPTE